MSLDNDQIKLPQLFAPRADFALSIKEYIAEMADRMEAAFGMSPSELQKQNVATLRGLANHAGSLDQFDRLVTILYDVNSELAALRGENGETARWVETETQGRLLAYLGSPGTPPAASSSFEELAAAGVRDMVKAFRQKFEYLREETKQAQRDAKEALERARSEVNLNEVATTNEENALLRKRVEDLEERLEIVRSHHAKETAERRIKVPGEVGVYEISEGSGTYEITFTNDQKEDRRRAPFASVEDARDARAELKGKPDPVLVGAEE